MFGQALWNLVSSDSGDLTRVKVERPNMSRKTLWNPDKVGWDLTVEELRLGRTCPVQESDMSS
jgi:hypothetical protein